MNEVKVRRWLLAVVVLLASAGWLSAQSDSFFCIGMNPSATYWGEYDYLADADSIGANWVQTGSFGVGYAYTQNRTFPKRGSES